MAVDFYSSEMLALLDKVVADEYEEATRAYIAFYMSIRETHYYVNRAELQNIRDSLTHLVEQKLHWLRYDIGEIKMSDFEDAQGVREYMLEHFGRNPVFRSDFDVYMYDNLAMLCIDSLHIDLFKRAVIKGGKAPVFSKAGKRLEAMYIICRYKELCEEIDALIRQAKRYTKELGVLTPNYRGSYLDWHICHAIMLDYFPALTSHEGYDLYYFEPEITTAVLTACSDYALGKKVEAMREQGKNAKLTRELRNVSDCYSYLKEKDCGVVYKFLDIQSECRMLPDILSTQVNAQGYNGSLVKYIHDVEDGFTDQKPKSVSGIGNSFNFSLYKPVQSTIGAYVLAINSELKENPEWNTELCSVFYCNTDSICIRVKEGCNIEELLPVNHKYFKKVENVHINNLIYKRYNVR